MTPWLEDLDLLLEKIEEIHPNPYHENSRETWAKVIEDVRSQIQSLPDPLQITQFYRIVALLTDSHSRINLKFGSHHSGMVSYLPPPYDTHFPFLCHVFSDGVYVIQASDPQLLGKKIININDTPILEIAEKLRPYLPIENEIGFIAYFPYFLRIPLFLSVIGVIDTPQKPISIEFNGGSKRLIHASNEELVHILDTLEHQPCQYLKPDQSLSIRQEKSSLIVDIREIQDTEEMTLRDLADTVNQQLTHLSQLPDYGGIHRLIIDLRENGGGNNILTQPLIRTIIQHPWIDYPGRLFVCINRWTFSAAINTANYLEQLTWALFAGEPFSGRVNHYGDSTLVTLPHSKLEVKISTLYWQDSDPRDNRHSIMPDIPVDLTYDQWIAEEDVLLDKIASFEVDDVWHEYYNKFPPRLKNQRESQGGEITTYFTKLSKLTL